MKEPYPLTVHAYQTGSFTEQIQATPGWVQDYQQMSPGHFRGQIRYLDLHGVEIYEEGMNTRVEQHFSAPQGSLAFCFDQSEQSLYLLNGESRNIWITPEHYRETAVVFGPQFVREHGLDVARLEGLFMAPLRCGQNQLFTRWLGSTLTRLAHSADGPDRDSLTTQLLDDCLFILDNASVSLDTGALQRRAAERRIMKRVFEWAADVPDETLNLVALARVAGVSLRQLQQAFKAYTGMAPAQWLRLKRLNNAHRELLRAQGSATTVAEVAMHWSFWHLGRFSSSYRALFDELPSETLKRKT